MKDSSVFRANNFYTINIIITKINRRLRFTMQKAAHWVQVELSVQRCEPKMESDIGKIWSLNGTVAVALYGSLSSNGGDSFGTEKHW